MTKVPTPYRLKLVYCCMMIMFFCGLGIGNYLPLWTISIPLYNQANFSIPITAIIFFIVLIGIAFYGKKLMANTHKDCVWCHKVIDLKTPRAKIAEPLRSENDSWMHKECYRIMQSSREAKEI